MPYADRCSSPVSPPREGNAAMIARRSACEKLAHIAISSNVRLQPTQKPESGSTVQIFMQGVSMGWKLEGICRLSQCQLR
jgi:hypothetical protein